MVILTCIKTGRWWRCVNEARAEVRARLLGLKDYTVEIEQ